MAKRIEHPRRASASRSDPSNLDGRCITTLARKAVVGWGVWATVVCGWWALPTTTVEPGVHARGVTTIRPEARLDAATDVGPLLSRPRTTVVQDRDDLTTWHDAYAGRCRDLVGSSRPPATPLPVLDGAFTTEEREWLGRLDALVARVGLEGTVGRPLLWVAVLNRVTICFDDRHEGVLGYFDRSTGTIVLDSSLTNGEAAVILVHELRHLERSTHGFVPSTAMPLSDAARYKQALEADVQAVSALYAWRAADLGDDGPWEAFLGFDRYADIGLALGDVLLSGGSAVSALDAAFQRWWASAWRTETYRFQALVAHLDAIDHGKRIEAPRALTDDDLDTLRRLPGGISYGLTPIPTDMAPTP